MYKKVVVAFDGSEGSEKALTHAVELSKTQQSQISVVFVEKEKDKYKNNTGFNMTMRNDMTLEEGGAYVGGSEERISEKEVVQSEPRAYAGNHPIFLEVKRKLEGEKIPIQYEWLEGDPVNQLCNFASTHEADLIVIGSRGHSGIKKFVIGSVSEKVAKGSDIPVLIVK